jgi:hypothetical protein
VFAAALTTAFDEPVSIAATPLCRLLLDGRIEETINSTPETG